MDPSGKAWALVLPLLQALVSSCHGARLAAATDNDRP